MSIATKTGDAGTTGLMYNRRVPKSHPRVEACGSVDELNAAVGLARATAEHRFVREHLLAIHKDLVIVMCELGTLPEDVERYVRDGYPVVTPKTTARLDRVVDELERDQANFEDWATPGANLSSAALDTARTVCRRAERCVCRLRESDPQQNVELIAYLNRLSDVLWLLARWVESQKNSAEEKTS